MTDPNEFIGPPQENPYEKLTPEQRERFDHALTIADGIKLYRAAGGVGVGAQWAPYAQELDKRGGLDEQEALNLARYRMWKQGMPVPLGPREQAPTPEDIDTRRNNFLSATPEQRAKMMEEDKMAVARSHQGYFDGLVGRPTAENKKKPERERIASAE